MLKILASRSAAAKQALARLNGRLAAMERLDTKEFRERAKKTFGAELTPVQIVTKILDDVRAKGDAALSDYTQRLDHVKLMPERFLVSAAERNAGYHETPREVRVALELAAERIADYQRRLLPKDIPLQACGTLGQAGHKKKAVAHDAPDCRTGLVWSPLQRVGVYVPGGTAAYPSSVLMNAIPAHVAGVKEIALATPCGKDGALSAGALCACEILGLKEIYKLGGAQAIGALAYGTKKIPAVEKIVGPGNLFVMLAKRAVFGHVDIDMLAGPSEVLVLAAGSGSNKARADWIAADLLAQAEHDPLASCVLITDSTKLAHAVAKEVERQLTDLPRREIAAKALKDWGLALVAKHLDEAVALANALAPEHLEIFSPKPEPIARRITTAGAIFLGPHTTEPLGDYLAGPSHTLPTGGTARAFSGVSVYTFLRRTSWISSGPRGLHELGEAVEVLARAEGLEAHRRAVAIRL